MNKKKLIILVSVIVILAALVCVGIFAVSGNRAKRVADKLDLGEKYLEELEYEKALAAYKEVLKIDPKSVEAYLGMAEVYIAMGDYEEALEILEEGYEETESRKLEKKIEEVEALMQNKVVVLDVADDFVIDWVDPNLETAMREITGIYDRDIVYGDVKDMTELSLYGRENITNISALKYMPKLEYLCIDY